LLVVDYHKRPSAEQALQHPWMQRETEKIDKDLADEVLKNLSSFRADQALKQATLSYIASQLVSKQEKEKMASLFKNFDKNSDGKLDKAEIQIGYEQYQGKCFAEEEIDEIFSRIDIDNSGYIDYTEFVAAALDMN
jgi:calcium-dependent protein kinase